MEEKGELLNEVEEEKRIEKKIINGGMEKIKGEKVGKILIGMKDEEKKKIKEEIGYIKKNEEEKEVIGYV